MSAVRPRTLMLAWGCLAIAAGVAGFALRVGSPGSAKALSAAPAAALNPLVPIPISGGWQYLADPADRGLRADWPHGGAVRLPWRWVSVPSVFNPVISSSADAGSVGWYKVRFTGPSPQAMGRSWNLRFEQVRRIAQVWLNGTRIGSSSNPYAPFSLPATSLSPGATNILVVRVDSRPGPGSFPQDWWNWGGIVRPVELVPVGRIALEDLGVMPELGCGYHCGELLVQGTLRNVSAVPLAAEITVDSRSPAGVVSQSTRRMQPLAPGASAEVRFRVPVPGLPDLWAPGHPSLYRIKVQTGVRGAVEQRDWLNVGMRDVRVRHGILFLNGHRLWLHGASIHEDMPGRGAALTDGDVDTIVSELRSVGANITRAHYLLNERLLEALDAAGIMVWSQPPVDHADPVLRSASGRAQALERLRATIVGGRSHASVVINSVANELSPAPDATPGTRAYLQQAIPLARRLDPVAPVAIDTYCYPGFAAQRLYASVDVLGIAHYFGWYKGLPGHTVADFGQLEPFLRQSHARYPAVAIVVAEFGAEALFDGPASTKGTYKFQSSYLGRTFFALYRLPFLNGAIYWTLREFAVNPGWVGGATLPRDDLPDGIHHKGLIDYNGNPKPAFAVARQLFSITPAFAR